LQFGLFRTCFPPPPAEVARRIERLWPDAERMFACFSVRTGFDLFLQTLDLPRGSEVLVSAITIPHMVRILEHHGLVPVPVDLDPQTMAPTEDAWRSAITPATRAILVAHLFGGRINVGPLIELAHSHNLLVFEDCAQVFTGCGYTGHPEADMSMFSFGVIKIGTALGGALLRVRDGKLLAQMRSAQAAYPRQNRWLYGWRLVKYGLMKILSIRPVAASFVFACQALGRSYDGWVNRAARGFVGKDLFAQIRRQPSAPLLAVLQRRLRDFDAQRWQRHATKGQMLKGLLDHNVVCPGMAAVPHNYWVFPILVEDPNQLIERLVAGGYDATQGASLCAVQPPAGRPEFRAHFAEELLEKVVFLPFYPELPERAAQRMATVVLEALGPQGSAGK
jgi:perosamine synthetase